MDTGIQHHDIDATLLLVDDRPENLIALEAVLSPLGCRCLTASTGEEALRFVLEQEFAAILLDVAMPGIDGYETARLIRQRTRSAHIPILFLTAFHQNDAQVMRGYLTGAVDYLIKPFTPEVLKAKVNVFVELFRQRRALESQAELLRRSMLALGSERRRSEEERRRREELERFTHLASHDLREPLRIVTTFSQLLGRRCGDQLDEVAKEYVGYIEESSRRIVELIDDMIAYVGLDEETDPPVAVPMREVLAEVGSRLDSLLRSSGAEILCEGLPVVEGIPCQLAMLFEQLIDNAIKFRRPVTPRIQIHATEGDGKFLFEVRDNGIGFAPEFAERIFLLFKRLHLREVYEGTGVGLALCKKIVERHGGKIWAESEPGVGTTFFFTLPGPGIKERQQR